LKIETTTLKLSAKVAERLDKKLRLRGVFAQGQAIGSTVTKVRPATVTVQGTGKASLTPNPATIAKLNELFVAVNPIFPAEHLGSAFTFSIFGGTIAIDASTGTLETAGSLEFIQLFGGQVFLHEPWVDLSTKTLSAEVDIEPTPTFPGKLGQIPITTLELSSAAISANPRARTVTVTNAPLALNAQSAASFNLAFAEGKEAFKAGDPVGVISFTARSQ
jgi:hypothetical protein